MAFNLDWVKSHWYYIAGGLLGLFVLYELVEALSGGGSGGASSSGDLSGAATQLQSLQAGANLADATANAQVETASYAADVANNQTSAALQLGLAQITAEQAVALSQTSASQDTTLGLGSDAVEAQNIVTNGQVKQTQIEGSTLDQIAATQASIPLAEINNVNSQIQNIQAYSKNAAKDYAAIAPVLAEETGQGSTAGAAKPAASGSSTASNISAAGGGIAAILDGLF